MFSVILIQSENSGNIGAIARTMGNFDFKELTLIDSKVEHLNDEGKTVPGWLSTLEAELTAAQGEINTQHNEIETEIATAWEEGGVTLASVDGAKMLRIVIEVVRGENFDVLKGDWDVFKQDDDTLAVFLKKFMYFVSLFSFFGVGMKPQRKFNKLVKKLNAVHRGVIINATGFAAAMSTLRSLVKHEKSDNIDRQREDDVSAKRAMARRAEETQNRRSDDRSGRGGGRGRGGNNGRGGGRSQQRDGDKQ